MQNEDDSESDPTLAGSGQPSSRNAEKGSHNSSQDSQPQDAYGERIKRIEKMVETMQSNKDKGVNKALSEVGELRKSLSEVQGLMKKGLSEDEAFEALDERKRNDEFQKAVVELRDSLRAGNSLSAQASGAKVAPSIAEVLKDFPDLDVNDPDVVSQVLTQTDPDKAELAASRLLRKRASLKDPSPTAVGAIISTPALPPNQEALLSRLSELQKNPTKNWKEMGELEKKLGWA